MAEKKIPFSPPDITEEEINEVVDTLRSGWITTGPKTKEFERRIAQYCGTERAVCLNSATACMEMTIRILGVGPGDEVITSAYTYTASASVVAHVGAKLVLVDTAQDSYEMDYERLEQAITGKTKAIIPVDLAGVPCDYNKIFEVVEQKKNCFQPNSKIQKAIGRIVVLADSAHAFGAERNGVRTGKLADFTSFSFHAVKNLTTAEGGAVTWKKIPGVSSDEIYREYMLHSLHGQTKDALAKTKLGGWEYDIIGPYFKCNMSDIMAALGLAQLRRYSKLLERRKAIIKQYDQGFLNLPIQRLNHYCEEYQSSGHLYLTRLTGKSRTECNQIIADMAERGIATNVHYKPLPMLTAYKKMGFLIEDYPNAYALYENEVTLPLHTNLSDDDVDYVIRMFSEII